jgi:hypothetical protein
MATTYSDFYKVSFITTSSANIPKLLKQTGGLIVMNETDDIQCTVNPSHGTHSRKSIWFRGDHIASGYGVSCVEERNNLTYLAGSYGSLFTGIDDRFSEYSYWLNTYNQDFLNAYAYGVLEHDRIKNESYCYTTNTINNLIGCAPETLDTLGEIAHWLEHDQELGLDTVQRINQIAVSYITHDHEHSDDESEVSYAYMSDKSFKLVANSYSDSHKHEGDTEQGGVFSYEMYTVEEDAWLAVKDRQVSTHYKEAQLSDVLDCIITPYPYTQPRVWVSSYTPAYCEVGVSVPVQVNFQYEVNDSTYIDNITVGSCMQNTNEVFSKIKKIRNTDSTKYVVGSDGETSYTVYIGNVTKDSGIQTFSNTLTPSFGANKVITSYSYTWPDSEWHYYPQLEKFEWLDDTHRYLSGTFKSSIPTNVYGMYKVYWNMVSSEDNVPTSASFTGANSQFILDFDEKPFEVVLNKMFVDTDHNIAWIAIPAYYDFIMYLRSIHTNVKQPFAKYIANPKDDEQSFVSFMNDSNSFYCSINGSCEYTTKATQYNIYKIENYRFNFSTEYEIILVLSKS